MRFSNIITLAFAASAIAFPTTNTKTVDARDEAPLITALDASLDKLGLGLDSTINELLFSLDLGGVDVTLFTVLTRLVGDVDTLVNGLVFKGDELIFGLGLGPLVHNIYDVEQTLGLSNANTVGDLLKGLHLIY